MKYAFLIFALMTSLPTFSQNDYSELVQNYLIDDVSISSLEINLLEEKMKKNLSSFMTDRITKKGEPFRVNINVIKKNIEREKHSREPKINLRVNFFEDSQSSYIAINKIKTTNNRTILRGRVKGIPGSKVRLVVYNDILTGRISFEKSKKIILLESAEKGISAMYEIDTNGLEYD